MFWNLVIAYIGPETMLPLMSVLAAIIGALLVGWRYVIGAIGRVFSMLTGRKKTTDSVVTEATASDDLPE